MQHNSLLNCMRKNFTNFALLCNNTGVQEAYLCLLLVAFKPSDKWGTAHAAWLSPGFYSQGFNFDGSVTGVARVVKPEAICIVLLSMHFCFRLTSKFKEQHIWNAGLKTPRTLLIYRIFNLFLPCGSVVSCQGHLCFVFWPPIAQGTESPLGVLELSLAQV